MVSVVLLLVLGSAAAAAEQTFVRDIRYTLTAADQNRATAELMAMKLVQEALRDETGRLIARQIRMTREERKVNHRSVLLETTEEEILSITAGITRCRVLETRWDGGELYLKAAITIQPVDLGEIAAQIARDRDLVDSLVEVRRRREAAFRESDAIRAKVSHAAAAEDVADLKAKYREAVAVIEAEAAEKLVRSSLVYLASEEHAWKVLMCQIEHGIKYTADVPRPLAVAFHYTITPNFLYWATYGVASFSRDPKDANELATIVAIGGFAAFIAIDLTDTETREDLAQMDSCHARLARLFDSIPGQLVVNTAYFASLGMFLAGGTALISPEYDEPAYDLSANVARGAVLGGAYGLLHTILFTRTTESMRDELEREYGLELTGTVRIEPYVAAIGNETAVGLGGRIEF